MSGQVLYYFCILLCTQILIVHCVAPLVAVEVDKLPSSRSYSATTTSHLFGGYIYIFEGITNNRDGKSDEILEYSLFDQSLQVVAHFPVDPGMCCGSLIPSTDSTYYYIGGEAESRDSRIIFHFNPDNRTVTIAGELPRSAFSPIVAKTGYSTGIVITDDFEAGAELFHLEFSGDTTNVTSSGRLPLDIHFSPEPTSIWDGTQSLYIFGSFSEVDANERGYVMVSSFVFERYSNFT